MDDQKVIKILQNDLGFSNKTIDKIREFNSYLLKYNTKYNLISKSTEKSLWLRHILDSAQIIRFIDIKKVNNIVDLGSGAGFPGLIIALFAENRVFHVKLYEKSPVKRHFLKNIVLLQLW